MGGWERSTNETNVNRKKDKRKDRVRDWSNKVVFNCVKEYVTKDM